MQNKKNWVIVGLIVLILILVLIRLTKSVEQIETKQNQNITPTIIENNNQVLMTNDEIKQIEQNDGATSDISFEPPEN